MPLVARKQHVKKHMERINILSEAYLGPRKVSWETSIFWTAEISPQKMEKIGPGAGGWKTRSERCCLQPVKAGEGGKPKSMGFVTICRFLKADNDSNFHLWAFWKADDSLQSLQLEVRRLKILKVGAGTIRSHTVSACNYNILCW